MKSAIVKRSVVIARQKTSVSLEDTFWRVLRQIAREQKMPLSQLITGIDAQRGGGNLSSAIRLFVLDHVRELTTQNESTHTTAAPTAAPPHVKVS